MSMFVCSTRKLEPAPPDEETMSGMLEGIFPVKILERHPFTSQTFIPLSSTPFTKYLVVVAPSLPASDPANPAETAGLPVPAEEAASDREEEGNRKKVIPGPGMPDLSRLRAFICEGHQAVTYAAGTWHAPMAVLRNGASARTKSDRQVGHGEEGKDTDRPLAFLVYQTNTDVPAEDCQEVVFSTGKSGEEGNSSSVIGAGVKIPAFDSEKSRH